MLEKKPFALKEDPAWKARASLSRHFDVDLVVDKKHVVVSVHGIRTFGHWQDRLKSLLEDRKPGIQVLRYVYGYFSMLAFLFPPARQLVVRGFREALKKVIENNPGARIDLVGHSFGTYVIALALKDLHRSDVGIFHTVILSGSVLNEGFDWSQLLQANRVKRVINDCGINDSVLVINQVAVIGTGIAGRIGFKGMMTERFTNRYFNGGHGLYFERGRKPDDSFMCRYWLPLLVSEDLPIEPVDQRPVPTIAHGIKTTILQNLGTLPSIIWGGIFAVLIGTYVVLTQENLAQAEQLQVEYQRSEKALQIARAAEESAKQEQAAAEIAKKLAENNHAIAQRALTTANKERKKALDAEAAAKRERAAAQAAQLIAEKQRDKALDNYRIAVSTLEWVFNENMLLEYNSAALSPQQRDLIIGLVKRLFELRFDGEIILEGHIGDFAIIEKGDAGPDNPDIPDVFLATNEEVAKMGHKDSIRGISREYAIGLGVRLSQSVWDALSSQGMDASMVSTISYGKDRPLYAYPKSRTSDYDEWNRVAQLNNRVVLRIENTGAETASLPWEILSPSSAGKTEEQQEDD